ncbi:ATP-grasp domain-containing protein [Vibrio sp. SCSIO 43140]|uniref:ATP-grasp domain-containing protein n=1 Tax=Vibrio sp. SCSIO 43140 TaxID=2819100 RepID=UPI002075D066|nr:ATP-grasp domain-containing protein [Vibrio sp. SCSIO 43140]USD59026.1 ATP-grasp domain-containing protein [Vibrio sp. SCSIO 43140]
MMIYLQRYGTPARLGREEQAVYAHCVKERLPVRYFEAGELNKDMLREASLVVGSVESYTQALSLLGVDAGRPNYYPSELAPFLGRDVKLELMAQLRQDVVNAPVFAKPAMKYKLFNGDVFTTQNIGELDHFHEDTPVWISEVVDFRSEFRVYVLEGEILACCQYMGEVDDTPDMTMVVQAVSLMSENDGPTAFAIDVGNDVNGRTKLVEFTDGFSLGFYKGLSNADYFQLLQSRWNDFQTNVPSQCPSCEGKFITETLYGWICADCGRTNESY